MATDHLYFYDEIQGLSNTVMTVQLFTSGNQNVLLEGGNLWVSSSKKYETDLKII